MQSFRTALDVLYSMKLFLSSRKKEISCLGRFIIKLQSRKRLLQLIFLSKNGRERSVRTWQFTYRPYNQKMNRRDCLSATAPKVYYCHPYSSFERGSNENLNKMIRRWFPKRTDFRQVTTKAIHQVEEWINNYPREIHGFRTAESVFQEGVACLI